jgi:tetratricopeptide (TPR) repeat protein
LLQVVSTALNTAERNGNAPWAGVFQAALGWLRFQTGDLSGARTIAEALLRTHTEDPAGQVRTIAMVISGYVELAGGVPDRALEWFTKVCGRAQQPRFFLDWYWRIWGRLGLAQAWLLASDLAKAGAEADRALEAALATADPALKALAWVVKTRIAAAQQDWDRAKECLQNAREALRGREIAFAASQVQAAAAEVQYGTV